MLEFKNVSKTFHSSDGEVRAIRDISFSVSSGELIVVQGPSGSGKTTLLLTAGALLEPSSGTVFIEGKDPYKMSANGRSIIRAQTIGFVFQQFHLIPYLTVFDNILAPAAVTYCENASERAEELMVHFNLHQRMNHFPSQLSTGERQRTAFARALLNNPNLILADEPTGNLDEENGSIILRHLSEFANQGRAVLVVTHDPKIKNFGHRTVNLVVGCMETS